MWYRVIAAGACVLALTGCQPPGADRGSLSSPAAPSELSAATAEGPLGRPEPPSTKPEVPFSGVVTGGLRFVANPQDCSSGMTGVSDATGEVLHMGRTTYHTEQCVNSATGAINGKVLVLTAANGDELHGTFTGQSEPAGGVGHQFDVTATFVFTGGTGRFEHATGTAAMTAVLTHEASFPWPGRWEWTGTIRY